MTMDPRPERVAPQMTPASPMPAETDRPGPAIDGPQTVDEPRTFSSDEAPAQGGRDEDGLRPQADFGAPISLGPDAAADEPVDAAADRTLTGGEIPPFFADVDETAEPHLQEPRTPQPLTVRIHQGMPSYSEPDPEIAGVVGRAARGGEAGPDLDDPTAPRPQDGGTP